MAENKIKKLSDAETSAFCSQMSLVLSAGIPAAEGIGIMLADTEAADERQLLQQLLTALEESGSLAHSLEECGAFPEYMVKMVGLGEETGRLDSVMVSLGRHYGREAEISRTVRNAVAYPAVMAAMMVVVLVVLLTRVMPVFNRVFIQLGSEMTGISGSLVRVGAVLSKYSALFVGLLVIAAVLALLGAKTAGGRRCCRAAGNKLGIVRAVLEDSSACRFAGAMALTLSGGMPSEQALEHAAALCEDEAFRAKAARCTELTAGGAELSAALHESGIFSGVYARMASIGEKTGSMEQAMDEIAARYQADLDGRIANMLSILEPTLVIVMSLAVGIILLSVMLPLLGIMSGI